MRESTPKSTLTGSIERLARFIASNRPFIVVWLALFLSILGVGMVSPLLPVFIEDMGASGIWLGLAFSGFAITQVPLMPVAGRYSDRFGKKLFLWAGLLLYAAASVGLMLSPGYQGMVIIRIFSGVGSAMVIPTAFAYIGELAPFGYEARYMAIFNLAIIAGYGIGPVLGGLVYDSFGMDAAFAGMGILSLLGSAIVMIFLPREKPSEMETPAPGAAKYQEPSSSYMSMLKDNGIRALVTFQLGFGMLFGTVLAFIGIWMTDEIGSTAAQVGIVLAARVVVNGTLVYPFGSLGDRVNRVYLATAGILVVVIGTFSIPWIESFVVLIGLFIVMGTFESMAVPSISAIAVEKGRPMGMGSVMGLYNTASSLGLVIGSIVGGLIETSMGLAAVFRCAALLGVVGVILFNVFMWRSERLPNSLSPINQPVEYGSNVRNLTESNEKHL